MAAVGTTSKVQFSYRDRSGEPTRTQLHFEPLDDTGDNSGILGALGTIPVTGTLLNALTDCVEAGTNLGTKIDNGSAGLPTSDFAQRELAARMTYQDTVTGKFYHFDIPGPNPDLIQSGTDDILMTGLVAPFKVAFDANCVSEMGNPVVLLSGKLVGRRS